jgi:phosphoglycolate phosphatase
MPASRSDRGGYSLLVFDWDGTLMDSLAQIVGAMRSASRTMGLPDRSEQQIHDIVGLGLPEAIQVLYPGLSALEIDRLRHHYSQSYQGGGLVSQLFQGVKPMLEELRSTGVTLSIATGKSRRGLDHVLQQQAVGHFFDSSRCADESQSKPHPQMLLDLMCLHGVGADRVLMIGDTTHDLSMARNAGVDSVGVNWGAHDANRLATCDPVCMVESISELHAWLLNSVLT